MEQLVDMLAACSSSHKNLDNGLTGHTVLDNVPGDVPDDVPVPRHFNRVRNIGHIGLAIYR